MNKKKISQREVDVALEEAKRVLILLAIYTGILACLIAAILHLAGQS